MWILECLIASFFVEAKRSRLEFNDASQALHNMYEFFSRMETFNPMEELIHQHQRRLECSLR